jgi:peptidoglycan/LPS O-acetylase OafA/YrhL
VTTSTALRIARYAEAVYAAIAIVLAFGLPLPPRGQNVVLFAHWIGTSLLAAAICLRLGRPNRQTWYVAALLSGYVLFNALVAIARLVGPESATLGRPGVLALAVGALLWVTQIIVAFCLYQARELRTMSSQPTLRR